MAQAGLPLLTFVFGGFHLGKPMALAMLAVLGHHSGQSH